MENTQPAEWYKAWFNSPYYHILYTHRDVNEATFFIDHLISFLKPVKKAQMLDLACGRGRHSVYLHQKGFDVTGVDLSEENIRYAKAFEENGLRFYMHDMRDLLSTNSYDYVFNLFTSFGYFERDTENERVIRNVSKSLRSGGYLLLDFLNVEKLRLKGSSHDEKMIDGIRFQLHREIQENHVIKTIQFEDKGQAYQFEEKVMLIDQSDFKHYFLSCGLVVEAIWGNYALKPFDSIESERIIFCVRKP